VSQTHGIETTSYGYGTGSDLLATLSVGGVQTQAIGYTADGRISSLSPGIQAPGGQTITSLSYNQDARLSAVNASGGALASYTYDGFGQRLIKTVSGSYGEIYQYGQNGMVLEATNASGAAQADYVYLDGRPIATLNPSTGALYFLHDDMLGTPQLATDSSQTVAWQATYEPFGQASVSGTVTQNLRFPGQYFDVESGWNHNGFRNYLPDLGRYAEPDPIGLAGGSTNLYAYVLDNPIRFTDPFGLNVTITYYPNAATGYGHVGVGVNSDQTSGFYPIPGNNSWCLLFNCSTPGNLLWDQMQSGYTPYSVTIPTTPEQDALMQAAIDRRLHDGGMYNLRGRNCARFVEDVLNAGFVPNVPDTQYPMALFRAMGGVVPQ
jgi:RHS repeat-associated protein